MAKEPEFPCYHGLQKIPFSLGFFHYPENAGCENAGHTEMLLESWNRTPESAIGPYLETTVPLCDIRNALSHQLLGLQYF